MDDGSIDASGRIARSFASPRCRVVQQEQQGASAARNHALKIAQGDFIQFLDADDFLAPDKLERQMQAHESGDAAGLSFGSVIHFLESPQTGERHAHPAQPVPTGATPADFLVSLWDGSHPAGMIQTSQWLTPRALIEKAGPWREDLSFDDDGEFFARVVLAASQLVAVPGALSYYRKFRAGTNLSARAARRRGARQSALHAAQMKSLHLLACADGPRARWAVRRLVTAEIIASWPAWTDLAKEGLNFLKDHGLALAEPEGSPWFQRLQPWIGWKAARWLQWNFNTWRERLARAQARARALRSTIPAVAGAETTLPAAAEHCNPRRATSRLPV